MLDATRLVDSRMWYNHALVGTSLRCRCPRWKLVCLICYLLCRSSWLRLLTNWIMISNFSVFIKVLRFWSRLWIHLYLPLCAMSWIIQSILFHVLITCLGHNSRLVQSLWDWVVLLHLKEFSRYIWRGERTLAHGVDGLANGGTCLHSRLLSLFR